MYGFSKVTRDIKTNRIHTVLQMGAGGLHRNGSKAVLLFNVLIYFPKTCSVKVLVPSSFSSSIISAISKLT